MKVCRSDALNERDCGDLTGLDKNEAADAGMTIRCRHGGDRISPRRRTERVFAIREMQSPHRDRTRALFLQAAW